MIMLHEGADFWKNYMERWFGRDLIDEWNSSVRHEWINSGGSRLHLEIYNSGDKSRPVLVFSHGMAGYARILLPFIIPLFKRGISIIAPDLHGYGYNEGIKGDFTWNEHVQNLVDTALFARSTHDGPVFLGGASMGGPLAYAASSKAGCVEGLVAWCLWDMADPEFLSKETQTGRITVPALPLFRLASKLFGNFRIKTTRLVSYDTLTDIPEMNAMVQQDPQAGRFITLRGASSLVTDSSPVPRFEDYTLPSLVFLPSADRMTPPKYTRRAFDRLGSKNKRLVEMEGSPHFPIGKAVYEKWAEETARFIESCRVAH